MKIFVTVGTTPFDRLIHTIDQIENSENKFIIQTANPKIKINNYKHFEWVENINQYYKWADLIICHAGAGTVYNLLEMNKTIIVVPNLDRIDHHQKEIANYIANKNYCSVCFDVNNINSLINSIKEKKFAPYKKESFFVKEDIIDFIRKKIH